MANIIAVVAVLEIHAEMKAVTAPKAKRMREGRAPTHLSESTPKARRRSSPCRKIARAMMNEPMKRNISGSANGAKTSFAGATRRTTHAAAPSERRHRHRQRLGDPQHDDRRHHRRQPVRLRLEAGQRQQEQHDEDGGREHEARHAPPALEARLGLGDLFDRLDCPIHKRRVWFA